MSTTWSLHTGTISPKGRALRKNEFFARQKKARIAVSLFNADERHRTSDLLITNLLRRRAKNPKNQKVAAECLSIECHRTAG